MTGSGRDHTSQTEREMTNAETMKAPVDSLYMASWVLSLNKTADYRMVQDGILPDNFNAFRFLNGEFDGAVTIGGELHTIEWKSIRTLNGWILRDTIKEFDSNGALIRNSVVIRTFSKDERCWKSVSLSLITNKISSYTGIQAGNTIILEGDYNLEKGVLERDRFLYIPRGDLKFTYLEQHTNDGGQSWQESRQALTLHKIL